MLDRFDKIPYEDLSPEPTWTRLGKGSFGCVFKGAYLGVEVAIKEVLASTEYDVAKYFEREVTILSSSRHPNIVQYLGLSVAPPSATSPHPRILIISEFLPSGNLRAYVLSSSPMPWRLRVSFAIDIARAVAYLHARDCLHRDLKGENVLLTENERAKVCDFGFARIAAQNDEEMRRISYCGTDGYMSPEILMGDPFSLPSDIFSLGIILLELLCRRLACSSFLERHLPGFGIDPEEVMSSLTPYCPPAFVQLALRCVADRAEDRPGIRDVLSGLQEIEVEILAMEKRGEGVDLRPADRFGSWNVGSVSFSGTTRLGTRRPSAAPRLPSFEGRVNVTSSRITTKAVESDATSESETEEDDLAALRRVDICVEDAKQAAAAKANYSTSVVGCRSSFFTSSSKLLTPDADDEEGNSVITVRASDVHQRMSSSLPSLPDSWLPKNTKTDVVEVEQEPVVEKAVEAEATSSVPSSTLSDAPSITNATIGLPSILEPLLPLPTAPRLVSKGEQPTSLAFPAVSELLTPDATKPQLHRFSLVKPHFQHFLSRLSTLASQTSGAKDGKSSTKCRVCEKKVGFVKPFLECDDCGFKCHLKCSDMSPPSCGEPLIPASLSPDTTPSTSPLPSPTSMVAPGKNARASPRPVSISTPGPMKNVPSKLRKKMQPIVA